MRFLGGFFSCMFLVFLFFPDGLFKVSMGGGSLVPVEIGSLVPVEAGSLVPVGFSQGVCVVEFYNAD